ncbi:glucosaminidase domain-containing protein, partial [bacterium AH-315-I11]|nr:glucosaminidase domain-containing protein [bacterium AH-315-I11]
SVEMPLDTTTEIQNIPDFAAIRDIVEKKSNFFNFLSPYINTVNQQILLQRNKLISLQEKITNGLSLSRNEMNYLSDLRVEYELENEALNTRNLINRLLKRVDIIPSSLALAQAANESAWGTSRFAREGNNFYGQWCYTEGCGIIPRMRNEGARHEVRRFDSVFDSVEAYIMNLNTFPNYQKLRDIRQQIRQGGRAIDGISLSEGLDTYSSRGNEYIFELQSMIYSNNLLELDRRDA